MTRQTANTVETERVTTVETEAPAIVDEGVEIFIPRRFKGDDQREVQINGKRWTVKVGETVKVPKHVAEVINRSIKQRNDYTAMIEKLEAENKKQ